MGCDGMQMTQLIGWKVIAINIYYDDDDADDNDDHLIVPNDKW